MDNASSYVKGDPIEREEDLHILYRMTWFASQSDLTREANDGRGPVDFKISKGSKDKTLVEFKLAKNTQLKRNLQKQAEIYERASDLRIGSPKLTVSEAYSPSMSRTTSAVDPAQTEGDPIEHADG